MPFTPFHMGPGTAIKAVSGNYFSLTVFGYAQIVIDIEPLVRIIRHDAMLHGISHTYLGALIIGLFVLFTGKPLFNFIFKLWNKTVNLLHLPWLRINLPVSWLSAATGAFIGTFSHVFLDSLIHEDVHPFVPFSFQNDWLFLVPPEWIYFLCLFLGFFGVIWIVFLWLWNKWSVDY